MDLRRTSPLLTQAQKLTVVSLADAKAQMRVSTTAEDALINDHIEAAYDFLAGEDGWLGRCCILTETFQYYIPAGPRIGPGFDYPGPGFGPVGSAQAGYPRRHWNGQGFEMPMRPFLGDANLTSFGVLQSDGTYLAMAPGYFNLVLNENGFAVIERSVSGFPWPYFGNYAPKAYSVTFTAGFGVDGSFVPSPIKMAIKMLAAAMYNQRETTAEAAAMEVMYGLKKLAGRYRLEPDHS